MKRPGAAEISVGNHMSITLELLTITFTMWSSVLAAGVPSGDSAVQQGLEPQDQRVDCGYVNISESLCTSRGCRFSDVQHQLPNGVPACYYPTPGVPIQKVHIVLSNHLDVGYTDLAAAAGEGIADAWLRKYGSPAIAPTVIRQYFDEFFPRAARVGAELHAKNGTSLKWMAQSWLLNLFLDCPASIKELGLTCPDAGAVKAIEAAIEAGHITWQAFPHNAQLSLGAPALLRELVAHTHALDDKFGLPHKRVLSQRDVPGLPRAAIAPLTAAGVSAISVGSNSRCLPPNVPLAFRWMDRGRAPPASLLSHGGHGPSGEELLVLWHPYGYGGAESAPHSRAYTRLPGHDEVIYYAWGGDNQGPPSYADVMSRYAHARVSYARASKSSLAALCALSPHAHVHGPLTPRSRSSCVSR